MKEILSITTVYLFNDETSAYDFIASEKASKSILAAQVKYHKATSKASEYWEVSVKELHNDAKDLIGFTEAE